MILFGGSHGRRPFKGKAICDASFRHHADSTADRADGNRHVAKIRFAPELLDNRTSVQVEELHLN